MEGVGDPLFQVEVAHLGAAEEGDRMAAGRRIFDSYVGR